MNEGISYAAAGIIETEDQISTPDPDKYEAEIADNWDQELFDLVAANADVVIKSPWHLGAEMTLSAAILSGPIINRENVSLFIAEVHQALANRAAETEEVVEQEGESEGEKIVQTEESSQEIDAETEDHKEQEGSTPNKRDADKQPKKEIPLETSAGNAEKISDFVDRDVPLDEAEPAAISLTDSVRLDSLVTTRAQEEPAATDQIPASQAPEPLNTETGQAAALEMPASSGQYTEPVAPPAVFEAFIKSEPAGPLPAEHQRPITTDEVTEPMSEIVQAEPAPASLAYQIAQEQDELSDTEIAVLNIVDHLEPEVEVSIPRFDDESNPSEQLGTGNPEQFVSTGLAIEEIEEPLIQLAEQIEHNEPEIAEEVNEILNKIIEIPARLKAHSGEDTAAEIQAQEELEELFIELLDKMDIDYTPELIESVARFTLTWHLSDEIEKLKSQTGTEDLPQDRGTHEIINKLLVGLSNLKKAMVRAGAIGKSALQLYLFSLAA